MRSLLHLHPQTQVLLGAWVEGDSRPQSYYEAHSSHQQAAADTMQTWLGEDWPGWCERLAQRTPTRVWWEAVDAAESESAKAVFQRFQE